MTFNTLKRIDKSNSKPYQENFSHESADAFLPLCIANDPILKKRNL